jgi:hypothetical protein
VLGLLLLKKSILAIPLMLPLIVATGLFSAYIRQERFRVANHLPLRQCSEVDQQRTAENFAALFKDAYLQPELQTKELYPETPPGQSLPRSLQLQGDDDLCYVTPNQSEAMDAGDATPVASDPLLSGSSLPPFSPSLDLPNCTESWENDAVLTMEQRDPASSAFHAK